MAIPLVHEDDLDMSFQEAFNVSESLVEKCFFCDKETRFWHHSSNQPVCHNCAPRHVVADLPVWKERPKGRAPKALSLEHIALKAENDQIRADEFALRRELRLLTNKKYTLHRKMADAKLVIKNPIK